MSHFIDLYNYCNVNAKDPRKSLYTRLSDPKAEIRVLHLEPGKWDDDICGKLEVVRLDSQPRYEALSYTWGASLVSEDCEKLSKKPITSSLHQALRRMRRHDSARCLWIDAVCINQADNNEKASQVSIMGTVYSLADTVLVWLGEYSGARSSDREDAALPHVHEVGRSINARGRRFLEILDRVLSEAEVKWHQRAWVIQEFALSQKTKLCFGQVVVPFDSMSLIVDTLTQQALFTPEMMSFIGRMESLFLIKTQLQPSQERSLRGVWPYIKDAECKLQHDKVYSVLSLMDPREADSIKVDYSLPLEILFAQATFSSIAVQRSFAILELIEFEEYQRTTLPSWTVDFALKKQLLGWQLHDNLHLTVKNAAANGDESAFVVVDESKQRLHVRGRIVGTVDNICPVPRAKETTDWCSQTAHNLADFLLTLNQKHKSQASPTTILPRDNGKLAKVLMPDHDYAVPAILERAFSIWEDVINVARNVKGTNFVPVWERGFKEELQRPPKGAAGTYLSYTNSCSGGSRVFSSDDGTIGVANVTTQIGDRVVLLSNEQLPVILRPMGDCYSFHGFAWVRRFTHDGVQPYCELEEDIILC